MEVPCAWINEERGLQCPQVESNKYEYETLLVINVANITHDLRYCWINEHLSCSTKGGNSHMIDTVCHPIRWLNRHVWGPWNKRDGYNPFWANARDNDFPQIHFNDLKNLRLSFCHKMLKNSNQIPQCFFLYSLKWYLPLIYHSINQSIESIYHSKYG
jgi:hypothetical protein